MLRLAVRPRHPLAPVPALPAFYVLFVLASIACACASVSLLAGCKYSQHAAGHANGENHQLYFAQSSKTDYAEAIAVGATFTVTVEHIGAQDVTCRGLGVRSASSAAGGTHIQGGSIDTEHCAGPVGDVVKLVSAACDDDACTVDADTSNERSVALRITGRKAGEARLRVSLASADGAATYDDAAPLSFGIVKRIRLNVSGADVGATKGPVVIGYSIESPAVAIVDDQDRRLYTGNDPPAMTYEGAAWVASEKMFDRIIATKPGHTVLRWRYAGLPDRTLDLEAVDAVEARVLYVYAAPPVSPAPAAGAAPPAGVDPEDITEDPYLAGGRITSLAFDSPQADADFPTRVALADGRLALAVLDTADVAPYDLIYARAAYRAPAFLAVSAGRAGNGTLTVGAGHAKLTLPVAVASAPGKGK